VFGDGRLGGTVSSPSENIFTAVEQAAYEAAIVPELWPRALELIGTVSDSAGAAVLCLNERGPHLVQAPILDRVASRFLDEGWIARNSRAGNVAVKGMVGRPGFLNEHDYFDRVEDAQHDPMVRDLFAAEGFGWAAGFVLQLPHGDLVVMNVEQFQERGPIRGEALARLDRLYPHLARAAMLGGRADFERVRTAVDTLTAIGLPAAALTPSGRVSLANEAFAGATDLWTTSMSDRLSLIDPVAGEMLATALGALDRLDGPRSIPLRQVAGGPAIATLQLSPIRRAAHDIFGDTVAIAVLSRLREGVAGATVVQSLLDLTPAEIAVAKAIAAGQTPADIARQTGRSVLTVRNQLKSVMAKTGSRRQVELALLMRQLGDEEP
jgi:DNA-binding CsgD family transcriptional regulator